MNKKPYQWAIVGAGPAGIAAVGKLLDHGITPKDILWLDLAFQREAIDIQDTIAVFGSSHSAIIVLHHLVSLGVKKIINFYRSPCRYAVDLGDSIFFDNTGLKGQAATWARENLDGTWPPNLTRYRSCEAYLVRHLPDCDKAIYATGFTRRNTIAIGNDEHHDYDPHVGIIGPGLFGAGIAYPERKTDKNGIIESQVGLWKFMNYLNRVMPIWFKYHA